MKKNIKFIILGLLIVSFLIITLLIKNHKTETFDAAVYNFITFFKNDTVTNGYKFITFFGSTTFIVLLCLIFLLVCWKNKKGFLISACLIISTVINNVIKIIVKRERPLDLMIVDETTYSFPSGHTMASVSMYGFLIYLVWRSKINKKYKIMWTVFLSLLILGIALSRIYLGAHYATDIIGAIIMSTIWLIIFINWIESKKII